MPTRTRHIMASNKVLLNGKRNLVVLFVGAHAPVRPFHADGKMRPGSARWAISGVYCASVGRIEERREIQLRFINEQSLENEFFYGEE